MISLVRATIPPGVRREGLVDAPEVDRDLARAGAHLHGGGDDAVELGPGAAYLVGERLAQALVQGYGLSFPVVHDRGNVLAGRFRVREMPVTFVVDGQGVVQWVGGPGQNEGDLAQAIAAFAK